MLACVKVPHCLLVGIVGVALAGCASVLDRQGEATFISAGFEFQLSYQHRVDDFGSSSRTATAIGCP